jgi:hypothetical protein
MELEVLLWCLFAFVCGLLLSFWFVPFFVNKFHQINNHLSYRYQIKESEEELKCREEHFNDLLSSITRCLKVEVVGGELLREAILREAMPRSPPHSSPPLSSQPKLIPTIECPMAQELTKERVRNFISFYLPILFFLLSSILLPSPFDLFLLFYSSPQSLSFVSVNPQSTTTEHARLKRTEGEIFPIMEKSKSIVEAVCILIVIHVYCYICHVSMTLICLSNMPHISHCLSYMRREKGEGILQDLLLYVSSYMPLMCLSYMPHKCLSYVSYVSHICLSYMSYVLSNISVQ